MEREVEVERGEGRSEVDEAERHLGGEGCVFSLQYFSGISLIDSGMYRAHREAEVESEVNFFHFSLRTKER